MSSYEFIQISHLVKYVRIAVDSVGILPEQMFVKETEAICLIISQCTIRMIQELILRGWKLTLLWIRDIIICMGGRTEPNDFSFNSVIVRQSSWMSSTVNLIVRTVSHRPRSSCCVDWLVSHDSSGFSFLDVTSLLMLSWPTDVLLNIQQGQFIYLCNM